MASIRLFCSLMVSVLLMLACAGARAQQGAGTLAKVARDGYITLGVREGSVPFSYLDDKGRFIGYSVDLCMKIVDEVGKRLGRKVEARMTPVSASNRIPLMANGTIDLECGSTTNNAERARQVAFSPTIFVIANRLLARKTASIRTLADMKGKTLVATAGTTTLKQMTALNRERNLGMRIVIGKDHPESFLMLETNRANAEANDDILLAAQVAGSKQPGDYAIGTEALSLEPYGIMLRRGDQSFKEAVDAAIRAAFASPDFPRLYAKWFTSPVPPKNINLNVPMSPSLRKVVANPTDSPDPAAYR
jgi:glutamate/aspartate transport system substrate-binding protein